MGLGGPVWHASTAPTTLPLSEAALKALSMKALDFVGDAARGQWLEWTGRAYHVRRRLSAIEEARVGPVVDIRGTPDARRRLRGVMHLLPADWQELRQP